MAVELGEEELAYIREIIGEDDVTLTKIAARVAELPNGQVTILQGDIVKWRRVRVKGSRLKGKIETDPATERAKIRRHWRPVFGFPAEPDRVSLPGSVVIQAGRAGW